MWVHSSEAASHMHWDQVETWWVVGGGSQVSPAGWEVVDTWCGGGARLGPETSG